MYENMTKQALMLEIRNRGEELEVIRNEHPNGQYSDDYAETKAYYNALVSEYRNRTVWSGNVLVWKDGDTSPVYLTSDNQ